MIDRLSWWHNGIQSHPLSPQVNLKQRQFWLYLNYKNTYSAFLFVCFWWEHELSVSEDFSDRTSWQCCSLLLEFVLEQPSPDLFSKVNLTFKKLLAVLFFFSFFFSVVWSEASPCLDKEEIPEVFLSHDRFFRCLLRSSTLEYIYIYIFFLHR